jgi:hypothetical protein
MEKPMRLNFVTIDVFTTTQFAGNPLGVVLNAEGLSSAQMQAIAAEFNLAETTFVLPPKDPAPPPRCASSRRAMRCRSRDIQTSVPPSHSRAKARAMVAR